MIHFILLTCNDLFTSIDLAYWTSFALKLEAFDEVAPVLRLPRVTVELLMLFLVLEWELATLINAMVPLLD